MARRVAVVDAGPDGAAVREALADRAAAAAERWAGVPGSPWLRALAVLEDRSEPVMFRRWQVRSVWPNADHAVVYVLDPDDSIRESVKDGQSWV